MRRARFRRALCELTGALLLSGVAFVPAPAVAAGDVYSWVDEDGSVHYTDDPALVPEKRRGRTRTTSGADIGEVPSRTRKEKAAPEAVLPPSPAPAEKAAAKAEVREDPEQTWRAKFREVHKRIATLEAQISADRKQLDQIEEARQPGDSSESAESARLKIQLRDEGIALDSAKKDLDDLEHQASQNAVPREWRH